MTRRVGEGGSPIDWRILLIGGVLGLGAVVVLVLLLFGGGGRPAVGVGVRQADDGRGHITEGVAGGPYSSTPATSGTHWASVQNWGIYSTALPEEAALHNLALFTSLAAALLPTPTLYKLAERRSTRHT